MPATTVLFFKEGDSIPFLEWMTNLLVADRIAWAKFRVLVEHLEQNGNELRRPQADFLRDGIYELRVKRGNINYRALYFFSGANEATISHGITKIARVPLNEIEVAVERKKLVAKDKERYTYQEYE